MVAAHHEKALKVMLSSLRTYLTAEYWNDGDNKEPGRNYEVVRRLLWMRSQL
jgi:hypothetical protein